MSLLVVTKSPFCHPSFGHDHVSRAVALLPASLLWRRYRLTCVKSRCSFRFPTSKSQFAMRAEAHQAQRMRVWLLVDQHQIRPDMTVAEAAPFP